MPQTIGFDPPPSSCTNQCRQQPPLSLTLSLFILILNLKKKTRKSFLPFLFFFSRLLSLFVCHDDDVNNLFDAGKDVSQKLYAVAEQAALTTTNQQPGRLPSLQVGGGGGSVGVNSTATYSSLGPWQGELLRSQSADAVHTCKQGQVRSIHWRRDQTRKVSFSHFD